MASLRIEEESLQKNIFSENNPPLIQNKSMTFKLGQGEELAPVQIRRSLSAAIESGEFNNDSQAQKCIMLEVSNSAFQSLSRVAPVDPETGFIELPKYIKQNVLRFVLREMEQYNQLQDTDETRDENNSAQLAGRNSDDDLDVPDEQNSEDGDSRYLGRPTIIKRISQPGITEEQGYDDDEEPDLDSQMQEDVNDLNSSQDQSLARSRIQTMQSQKPKLVQAIEQNQNQSGLEQLADEYEEGQQERRGSMISSAKATSTNTSRSDWSKQTRIWNLEMDENQNMFEYKHQETQFAVKLAFLMQGNYVVALTRNKKSDDYYLELYRYNQPEALDRVKIYHANYDLKLHKQHSNKRRFALIVLQECYRKDQSMISQEMIVLDSTMFQQDFNNSQAYAPDPFQTDSGFSISSGLRRIKFDDSEMRDMKGRVWCIYSAFDRDNRSDDIPYIVMQNGNFDRKIYEVKTATLRQTVRGQHNSFETKMFRFNPSTLFADTIEHILDGQNQLPTVLKLEVIEKCTHEFLNQKIINIFQIELNKKTIVYSDGSLQTENVDHDDFDQDLQDQVILKPFQLARHCQMSRFGGEKDRTLIFNARYNQQNCITAYRKGKKGWRDIFHISDPEYCLASNFGRILYMRSLKGGKSKLLEIGGKHNSEVVTQMFYNDVRIEACTEMTSYLLTFTENTPQFTWKQFKTQYFKQCSPPRCIVQLCDPFKVTLDLDRGAFAFARSDLCSFEVKMPSEDLRRANVQAFYPVLSPDESTMIVALRFGFQQRNQYDADKYQRIVLFDLQNKQSKAVSYFGDFCKIWYESDSHALVQLKAGIKRIQTSLAEQEIQNNFFDGTVEDQLSDQQLGTLPAQNNEMFLFPPLNHEKRHIFAVKDDFVWLVDSEAGKIVRLPVNREDKCTQECEQQCTHDFSGIETLAQLSVPEQAETGENKGLNRWLACFSQDEDRIYTAFVNHSSFCWLTWFTLSEDRSSLQESKKAPILIPKGNFVSILPLNRDQVVIQDVQGFTIVNIRNQKVEFKRNLKSFLCSDLTISGGCISLPRALYGHILNFSVTKSDDAKINDKEDQSFSSQIGRQIRNLNEYLMAMETVYNKRFPGFYLCFDEQDYEWQPISRTFIFYVKIMMPDFVYLQTCGHKADKNCLGGFSLKGDPDCYPQSADGKLLPIESYSEMVLLKLEYSNFDSIWDKLFSFGLMKGLVNVDDNQLRRITMANTDDKNCNLLHHWARDSKTKLRELFQKTSICLQNSESSKRFPFFLNFDEKSPLDILIEKNDSSQFSELLGYLIQVQDCFESAHIIDNVLIKAIKSDLDLQSLFQSRICSQLVTRDAFANFDSFPEFHEDPQTISSTFNGTWTEFLASKNIISYTFGEAFANGQSRDKKSGSGLVSLQNEDQSSALKNPIWYTVDYFMTSKIKGTGATREFIEALASTRNIQMFRTGYVQRFIQQQWSGALTWFLWLNLFLFFLVYALLVSNCVMMSNSWGTMEASVRLANSCVAAGIICIIVGVFELLQACQERWAYFKSASNYNDIFFFVTFWAYFGCEWQLGSTVQDSEHYEVTRILLSLLLLSGFAKLMNLNKINSNTNFIVRMIVNVSITITPFLTLFVSLIVLNMFIFYSLGLSFDSMGDENPYKDIGSLSYFFFLFRTSMGDFEVDQFKELTLPIQLTLWLFWTGLVFVNTIVFLNFLIAVINDAYTQVMETRTEEIVKQKAQLLLELQNVLGSHAHSQPPHLWLTRSSELVKQVDTWDGVLAEIKKVVTNKATQVERAIQTQMLSVERILKEQHYRTETSLFKIDRRLLGAERRFHADSKNAAIHF